MLLAARVVTGLRWECNDRVVSRLREFHEVAGLRQSAKQFLTVINIRSCVERSSDQFQDHFRHDTPRRVAAEAMISERQYRICMVLPKSENIFGAWKTPSTPDSWLPRSGT